jgi:putative Holliday junction resolvase
MPRHLGIDYGHKRIGIAISDSNAEFAFPSETLQVTSKKKVFAHLREICQREAVGDMVIGLPLNMNGSEGPMAETVRHFADDATRRLGLRTHLWDERLTSAEVEGTLLAADVRREDRRKVRDKLAAQRILQSYLDAQAERKTRNLDT